MPIIILMGFAAVALWSLVAHRFDRVGIAGPAGLAALGALAVVPNVSAFTAAIDSDVAQHVVELILAVLLFVDACEVRGGLFGGEGRSLARLVLVALPLSLALVVVAGVWLLPQTGVFVLIVIACIVMPTDFAPATALLRSERIPARVRRILNVESGWNDGLVSPVFGMSLAIAVALPTLIRIVDTGGETAGDESQLEKNFTDFFEAFFGAVPATLSAVVVGVLLGGAFGLLTRWAARRGWADSTGIRFGTLLTPLLAYGIATLHGLGANGFVAAFVAGVIYRVARTRRTELRSVPHEELLLVEEASAVASNFVWFILGGMTTAVIADGIDWRLLVIAVLALTAFRAVPVYLSMLGSPIGWRDRTFLGLMGPRGTASIVFGLLAFNRLPEADSGDVLTVTVLTVVGSILLHGVAAPFALRRITPETTMAAVPGDDGHRG
ncbi:cation:proton antiporter [Leifsonia naganoensis]|uniref:NhaP-type Na+/H+ or K+/H+ antiporter n=1 Tax=Leifsonia naganoensis TaxID=150025 RepID=A0A853DPH5_9MICO|nr:cation:proton antiporter [Leifsonia naganoensis]NYK09523.1 NhaP-type Na+/H+ or K+/H+ antiporter [Leifsonia naganoensis]